MSNNPMIFLIIFGVSMIVIPYILQIEFIRNIISHWLSFSNNPDYKIAYIQLIGSIIGTFLSVYGALYIQKEQQRMEEKKKKRECAQNIYTELNTCFSELQSIFRETKLIHKISKVEKDNIEKFCDTAIGRKLSMSGRWVENLAGAGDTFSDIDVYQIYKFYYKLQVIQEALQTKNREEIQKIYVPYICWFITMDGNDIHNDIKTTMNRFEKIINEKKL